LGNNLTANDLQELTRTAEKIEDEMKNIQRFLTKEMPAFPPYRELTNLDFLLETLGTFTAEYHEIGAVNIRIQTFIAGLKKWITRCENQARRSLKNRDFDIHPTREYLTEVKDECESWKWIAKEKQDILKTSRDSLVSMKSAMRPTDR
jgi:hypothetical protein